MQEKEQRGKNSPPYAYNYWDTCAV